MFWGLGKTFPLDEPGDFLAIEELEGLVDLLALEGLEGLLALEGLEGLLALEGLEGLLALEGLEGLLALEGLVGVTATLPPVPGRDRKPGVRGAGVRGCTLVGELLGLPGLGKISTSGCTEIAANGSRRPLSIRFLISLLGKVVINGGIGITFSCSGVSGNLGANSATGGEGLVLSGEATGVGLGVVGSPCSAFLPG
ncbi:hypothetical protein [Moorena sp. SIO4G3]|uniref:hypothetical protein n=1 Tax=Moorena sp. SIO4G3 TaxID=2607821 RepID=UPI00142C61BB|nr:hypothetical protein [Moorena sp. SIO4G3]NEO75094.1 hypothetical protein [Moorena sp. SIO4G3]